MRLLILGLLVCGAWAGAASEDGEWRLVYKTCGANGEGNEAVVEESVMNMDIVRNGYYRGNSQSVEMMGQCEPHLDACECLQCFIHALHYCPASLSAQVRLNNCFLAYSFRPNSFPPGRLNNTSSSTTTKRIAAIVVGAVVVLLLALLFLSFLRSRYSKRHYHY